MRVESVLSEGKGAWSCLAFRTIDIEVCHRDAHRRICIPDFEIPADWSDEAGRYLAVNYARRNGVPAASKQIAEEGVPEWLLRSEPDYDALAKLPEDERFTHESSAKQIIHRMAGAWTWWGWHNGYFDTESDAKHFYDQWCYLIAARLAMPASTQWSQTGLHWAYGTTKPSKHHYYVDAQNGDLHRAADAYERPLHHHCFIYGVEDDLAGDSGIAGLWQKEMRIFQRGSGSGTNLSGLRSAGERLSGGNEAGGLLPFIEAGEHAAGTIRLPDAQPARKLTLIDADHPDLPAVLRRRQLTDATCGDVSAALGVRLPDVCLGAAQEGANWELVWRSETLATRRMPAREYLDDIAQWQKNSAQGVVQFADTIAHWHGFSAHADIRASGPDGAFMFFNDSACDVVTVNTAGFVNDEGQFDVAGFEQAVRLMMIMSDISVTMAQYPTREIAYNSYRYRPVGLSMANVGLMLLRMGYSYDSAEGRAIASAVAALLTGKGYKVSAEIACEFGAFEAFSEHRDAMLRILWQHHEAAFGREHIRAHGVHVPPLDHASLPDSDLSEAVQRVWDGAMIRGDEFGYSNAQISLVANSANVAILMDQVSQGLSPLPALSATASPVLKEAVSGALSSLGYSQAQRDAIGAHLYGHGDLKHAVHINFESLQTKGFTARECQLAAEAIEDVTTVSQAFDPLLFGEGFCRDVLGLNDAQRHDGHFCLLHYMGFSQEQIAQAQACIYGTGSMENAPFLREEDKGVFAGVTMLDPQMQIKMMACVQPFISGGIAHHISLPHDAESEQAARLIFDAWQAGLKQLVMGREQLESVAVLPMPTAHVAAVVTIPNTQQASVSRDIIHPESEPEEAMQHSLDALAELIEKHHDAMQPSDDAADSTRVPGSKTLPFRRRGYSHDVMIGHAHLSMHVSEFDDGTPAEVKVTVDHVSPVIEQMIQQCMSALSVALQHGLDIDPFAGIWRGVSSEPCGEVNGNPDIDTATSVLDYIMHELQTVYHAAPKQVQQDDVQEAAAVSEEAVAEESAMVLSYSSLA